MRKPENHLRKRRNRRVTFIGKLHSDDDLTEPAPKTVKNELLFTLSNSTLKTLPEDFQTKLDNEILETISEEHFSENISEFEGIKNFTRSDFEDTRESLCTQEKLNRETNVFCDNLEPKYTKQERVINKLLKNNDLDTEGEILIYTIFSDSNCILFFVAFLIDVIYCLIIAINVFIKVNTGEKLSSPLFNYTGTEAVDKVVDEFGRLTFWIFCTIICLISSKKMYNRGIYKCIPTLIKFSLDGPQFFFTTVFRKYLLVGIKSLILYIVLSIVYFHVFLYFHYRWRNLNMKEAFKNCLVGYSVLVTGALILYAQIHTKFFAIRSILSIPSKILHVVFVCYWFSIKLRVLKYMVPWAALQILPSLVMHFQTPEMCIMHIFSLCLFLIASVAYIIKI